MGLGSAMLLKRRSRLNCVSDLRNGRLSWLFESFDVPWNNPLLEKVRRASTMLGTPGKFHITELLARTAGVLHAQRIRIIVRAVYYLRPLLRNVKGIQSVVS
jgi:hypothetical protein